MNFHKVNSPFSNYFLGKIKNNIKFFFNSVFHKFFWFSLFSKFYTRISIQIHSFSHFFLNFPSKPLEIPFARQIRCIRCIAHFLIIYRIFQWIFWKIRLFLLENSRKNRKTSWKMRKLMRISGKIAKNWEKLRKTETSVIFMFFLPFLIYFIAFHQFPINFQRKWALRVKFAVSHTVTLTTVTHFLNFVVFSGISWKKREFRMENEKKKRKMIVNTKK